MPRPFTQDSLQSAKINWYLGPYGHATFLCEYVQATCRQSAGNVQAKCRQRAGNVQATCRQSAGNVQATCRQSAGKVQAKCRQSAGNVPPKCRQRAGNVQATFKVNLCYVSLSDKVPSLKTLDLKFHISAVQQLFRVSIRICTSPTQYTTCTF